MRNLVRGCVRRARYWADLLKPGWRWLVAAPLAAAGALAFIRDELVPVERVVEYKFLAWLPAWPWQNYALALCVVLIVFILEGSYRVFSRLEDRLSALEDDYAHKLTVETIYVKQSFVNENGTHVEYAVKVHNGSQTKSIGHALDALSIDGFWHSNANGPWIVVPPGKTKEWPLPPTIVKGVKRASSAVTVRIKYGPPSHSPIRVLTVESIVHLDGKQSHFRTMRTQDLALEAR